MKHSTSSIYLINDEVDTSTISKIINESHSANMKTFTNFRKLVIATYSLITCFLVVSSPAIAQWENMTSVLNSGECTIYVSPTDGSGTAQNGTLENPFTQIQDALDAVEGSMDANVCLFADEYLTIGDGITSLVVPDSTNLTLTLLPKRNDAQDKAITLTDAESVIVPKTSELKVVRVEDAFIRQGNFEIDVVISGKFDIEEGSWVLRNSNSVLNLTLEEGGVHSGSVFERINPNHKVSITYIGDVGGDYTAGSEVSYGENLGGGSVTFTGSISKITFNGDLNNFDGLIVDDSSSVEFNGSIQGLGGAGVIELRNAASNKLVVTESVNVNSVSVGGGGNEMNANVITTNDLFVEGGNLQVTNQLSINNSIAHSSGSISAGGLTVDTNYILNSLPGEDLSLFVGSTESNINGIFDIEGDTVMVDINGLLTVEELSIRNTKSKIEFSDVVSTTTRFDTPNSLTFSSLTSDFLVYEDANFTTNNLTVKSDVVVLKGTMIVNGILSLKDENDIVSPYDMIVEDMASFQIDEVSDIGNLTINSDSNTVKIAMITSDLTVSNSSDVTITQSADVMGLLTNSGDIFLQNSAILSIRAASDHVVGDMDGSGSLNISSELLVNNTITADSLSSVNVVIDPFEGDLNFVMNTVNEFTVNGGNVYVRPGATQIMDASAINMNNVDSDIPTNVTFGVPGDSLSVDTFKINKGFVSAIVGANMSVANEFFMDDDDLGNPRFEFDGDIFELQGNFLRVGGELSRFNLGESVLRLNGENEQRIDGGNLFTVYNLEIVNKRDIVYVDRSIRVLHNGLIADSVTVDVSDFNIVMLGDDPDSRLKLDGRVTGTVDGGIYFGGLNTVFAGQETDNLTLEGRGTITNLVIDIGSANSVEFVNENPGTANIFNFSNRLELRSGLFDVDFSGPDNEIRPSGTVDNFPTVLYYIDSAKIDGKFNDARNTSIRSSITNTESLNYYDVEYISASADTVTIVRDVISNALRDISFRKITKESPDKTYVWPEETLKYYDVIQEEGDARATLLSLRNVNIEEGLNVLFQFNSVDINGVENLFSLRGDVTVDGSLENFNGPDGNSLTINFDQDESAISGIGSLDLPKARIDATGLEFSLNLASIDSLFLLPNSSALFNGEELTTNYINNEGTLDVDGNNRDLGDIVNSGQITISGDDYNYADIMNTGTLSIAGENHSISMFINDENSLNTMNVNALSFDDSYSNLGESTHEGMNHVYNDTLTNEGLFTSTIDTMTINGELFNRGNFTANGNFATFNDRVRNESEVSSLVLNSNNVTLKSMVLNSGNFEFNGSDASLEMPLFNNGIMSVGDMANEFTTTSSILNDSTFTHNGAFSNINNLTNNGTYTQNGNGLVVPDILNNGTLLITGGAVGADITRVVNEGSITVDAADVLYSVVQNNSDFLQNGSNAVFDELDNFGEFTTTGNDNVFNNTLNDSTFMASGMNITMSSLENGTSGVMTIDGSGQLSSIDIFNAGIISIGENYEQVKVDTDIDNQASFTFNSPLTIDGTYRSRENSINELFADFTLTSEDPFVNEKGATYTVEDHLTNFLNETIINIVANGATLSNVTTEGIVSLTDSLYVEGNLTLKSEIGGQSEPTLLVTNNVSTFGDVSVDVIMYGTELNLNEDRRTFTGLLNITNTEPTLQNNTDLNITNELYMIGDFVIDSTRIVNLDNYKLTLDGSITVNNKASLINGDQLDVVGNNNSVTVLETDTEDAVYSSAFNYLNLMGNLTVLGNNNEFAIRDSIYQNGPYKLDNSLANLVVQDGAKIIRESGAEFLPNVPNYTGMVDLVYQGNSTINTTGEVPDDVSTLNNMLLLTDVNLVKSASINGYATIIDHELTIDGDEVLTINMGDNKPYDMQLRNPGASVKGDVDGNKYLVEYLNTGSYLMSDEIDRDLNNAQIYFNSTGTYRLDRDYELSYIVLEAEKFARLNLNGNAGLFLEETLDTGANGLVNSIDSGSGEFLINGTQPQTIIVPMDQTFRMSNNTTLDNVEGVSLVGGNMTLAPQEGTFITNGYVAFTFSNGIYTTEKNNYLTLVQSALTETTAQGFVRDLDEGAISHVNGNVRKFITRTLNDDGAQARSRIVFPVGTAKPDAYYRPLEFYMNEIEEGVDLTVRFDDTTPDGYNGLGELSDPLVTKYPSFHWSVYSIPTLKEATEYEIHAYAEGFSIPENSAIEEFSLIRRDVSSLDEFGVEFDPNTNPWEYTGSNYDNEESDEEITTTIIRAEGATGDIKENPVKFTYGYAGQIEVQPIASKLINVDAPTENIDLDDVFYSETELEFTALTTDTEETYIEFDFSGSVMSITPVSATDDTTVTVVYSAEDAFGENLTLSFNVRVVNGPSVESPLDDIELTISGDSVYVSFSGVFASSIADLGLNYSITNTAQTISEVTEFSSDQQYFVVDDLLVGNSTLLLTVSDSLNATATDTINVVVNDAPSVNDIPNQLFTVGQTVGVPFNQVLSTSNGTAPYTYSVSSDNELVAVVELDGNQLSVTPSTEAGVATITYVSLDARNVLSTKTFVVEVNEAVEVSNPVGNILLDLTPIDNPNRVAPSDTTLTLNFGNIFAGGSGSLSYAVQSNGDYFNFVYDEPNSSVTINGLSIGNGGYFTVAATDSFEVSAVDTVFINVVNSEYPDSAPYWDTVSLTNDPNNIFWDQNVLTDEIIDELSNEGIDDFEMRLGFFSNIENVRISAAEGDTLSFLFRAIESGSNSTEDVDYELGNNPPAGAVVNKVEINGLSYGKFDWAVPEGFDTGELNIRIIAYNVNDEQLLIEDFSTIFVSANTSIEDELPTEFALKQNYPNPFNPSTNISYSILEPVSVTLNVYNSLGQKVATLVNNKMQSAGTYSVSFDASNFTSGIYMYRIQAGEFVQTKKMLLIK